MHSPFAPTANAEFNTWIDAFIAREGLSLNSTFTKSGPVWGENHIRLSNVVDELKAMPRARQAHFKTTLTGLIARHADPLPFFDHLAADLAF